MAMLVSNVLNCSFPNWYNEFKSVTAESIIVPLPDTFLEYLHTDGLVLPESSTHGLYTKSKNMAMDADEDDEDIRDDELMKMYEADWSTPSAQTESAEAPDFGEFDAAVKAAIKNLGGRVFPKLNWSAPKDATWISFDRTLMCTCPSDVYLLLKSSQFVAHDLDQPFTKCEDFDESQTKPSLSYHLVLRKWEPPDPSMEFRCFVYKNTLIGICQRNSTKFFSHIVHEKTDIVEDIVIFHNKKISKKFPDSCYVFDVVRHKKGKVQLIDFNPYGNVTDAILYTWDEMASMAHSTEEKGEVPPHIPDFRCVESEEGVQSSDYANYAFPLDIQDLTAGTDPYKFMDLMKMKIQKEGDSSSSDEDDSTSKETGTQVAGNQTTDKQR